MSATSKLATFDYSGKLPSSGGKFGLDSESATEVHATGTNELKRASVRHKPFGKLGIKGHPK